MSPKTVLQSIVVFAVVAASFATTGSVLAGGGCPTYVTVQSGDTLNSIASMCGTTVEAIQAANPGLGSSVQVGQVLYIPTGDTSAPGYYPPQMGSSTYVVQWGDTLGEIAARNGISLNAILAANPQIRYPSLIYPGQVINLSGAYAVAPSMYYPPNYCTTNCYPPTYNAPNNYAPNYNPPTYGPNVYFPPAPPSSQIRGLKVTYKHGLVVRTGPGRYYGEIAGPYVSAVKNSTWPYIKGSTTVDRQGFVWVQINLPRVVDGYSTGWIVVKDGLGNYYTDPNIDP